LFDEKTEELARELNLEVCFPSARLRQYLDDMVVTTRIAEEAGVECVPNVLAGVDSYETLRRVSQEHDLAGTPTGDVIGNLFVLQQVVVDVLDALEGLVRDLFRHEDVRVLLAEAVEEKESTICLGLPIPRQQDRLKDQR
jgi:hypothetical protein